MRISVPRSALGCAVVLLAAVAIGSATAGPNEAALVAPGTIAFERDVNGTSQLVVTPPFSREQRQITNGKLDSFEPTWSGQQSLIYAGETGKASELFSID